MFSNNPRLIALLHSLISCRWSGVRFYDEPDLKLFILVGWNWSSFVCCLVYRGSSDDLLLQTFSGTVQEYSTVTQHVVCVESSSMLVHIIRP